MFSYKQIKCGKMIMEANAEMEEGDELVALIPTLARTLAIGLGGMWSVEVVKLALFPRISILEALGMTLFLVTAIAGIVFYFVHRRTQRLEKEMELERRMRVEAEEYMSHKRQEDGNPNRLTPGYAC
jgi:hypothetical protein